MYGLEKSPAAFSMQIGNVINIGHKLVLTKTEGKVSLQFCTISSDKVLEG